MFDTNNHAPCYFMELPTELRLMIYRYVLPEVVKPNYQPQVHAASILRVNHQVNQEACSVLYGETRFEASVDPQYINLQGKTWSWTTEAENRSKSPFEICSFPPSARRIRNLTVEVTYQNPGFYLRDVGCNEETINYKEEFHLFKVRDRVRRLVDFLGLRNTPLKRLDVRPRQTYRCDWSTEEIIAAMFMVLGPFTNLHGIEKPTLALPNFVGRKLQDRDLTALHSNELYLRLREEWLSSIRGSTPGQAPIMNKQGKRAYSDVETLSHLIDYAPWPISSFEARRTVAAFHNFTLPLHFARVAYGNNDSEALVAICEATRARWFSQGCRQIREAHVNSQAISDVLQARGAVEPRTKSTLPMSPSDWPWSESEIKCEVEVPKRGEPGVTIKEDNWRIYIYRGDKMWTRLKTPQSVREAQKQGSDGKAP